MADTKKLLEQRNARNRKKPDFVVKESKFTSGVKRRWRYPRGKHSSVRQRHKGRPALPGPGYGAAREVRGLHVSGLIPVLVRTQKELESLDSATQGAILSGKLGMKKRRALLEVALEKKIPVLEVKDVAQEIKNISESFTARTKLRKEEKKSRKEKSDEKKKSADSKKEAKNAQDSDAQSNKKSDSIEQVVEEKDSDSKKKQQKKEVEKTITKRQ